MLQKKEKKKNIMQLQLRALNTNYTEHTRDFIPLKQADICFSHHPERFLMFFHNDFNVDANHHSGLKKQKLVWEE